VEHIAFIFRVEEISACHLLACWSLAELISSTLEIEAICSSETSVDTKRTTRRHIPEDDILHYKETFRFKDKLKIDLNFD
jgi:hypothetical protein